MADIAHAYSCVGQHAHKANPTESATCMDGLQHCFRRLIGSNHQGLSDSGPTHKPDQDLYKPLFADLGEVL